MHNAQGVQINKKIKRRMGRAQRNPSKDPANSTNAINPTNPMNNKSRTAIKPGTRVRVVQKKDQRKGELTEGIVKDILTRSATHPHGIKVRLESGIVGRVKEIVEGVP
jgi:uncharacterized repeat protein (TIGR03833 family)